MTIRRIACWATLSAVSAVAQAQSYESHSVTVNKIQSNAPAFSGRNVIVSLNGVSTLCTSPASATAYANRADATASFDVMLSSLLTAKASGRAVHS